MKWFHSVLFAGALALFAPAIASAQPAHIDHAFIQNRDAVAPSAKQDVREKKDVASVNHNLRSNRKARADLRFNLSDRSNLNRPDDDKRFEKRNKLKLRKAAPKAKAPKASK